MEEEFRPTGGRNTEVEPESSAGPDTERERERGKRESRVEGHGE